MMTDKRTELVSLFQQKKMCAKCPISVNCKSMNNNIVIGAGHINAKLFIVGEAPGEDEDLSGKPFQGMAGKMLDKLLQESGINREETYISNSISCRPYEITSSRKGIKNRPPTDKEIQSCKVWLWKELNIVQPKIILTLGMVPTRLLLKIDKKSSQLAEYMGNSYQLDYLNAKLFPCWHPSYVLRSPKVNFPIALKIFALISDQLRSIE